MRQIAAAVCALFVASFDGTVRGKRSAGVVDRRSGAGAVAVSRTRRAADNREGAHRVAGSVGGRPDRRRCPREGRVWPGGTAGAYALQATVLVDGKVVGTASAALKIGNS